MILIHLRSLRHQQHPIPEGYLPPGELLTGHPVRHEPTAHHRRQTQGLPHQRRGSTQRYHTEDTQGGPGLVLVAFNPKTIPYTDVFLHCTLLQLMTYYCLLPLP